MNFGNAQSGVGEGLERGGAIVEFEREVAGVVVDANALLERFGIEILLFTPLYETREEGEGFFGVFEMTERLRLQAQVEIFS